MIKNFLNLYLFIFLQVSLFSENGHFRIVYLIHGDGNYLFHDNDGAALNASERIFEQAKYVAENLSRGEVFIFYQKPANNFLLFFPADNCEFHYFKNGLKISEESYSDKPERYLTAETELIKKYSEPVNGNVKNIFLYYGHKIPEEETSGYHSSRPEKGFGLNSFAGGLEKIINCFSPPPEKFDLIILSTCRNGNQLTIKKLAPLTDYLIASPGDIHLSHLNSESLIYQNRKHLNGTFDLAVSFAKYSYKELIKITSTEISLSVYDIKKISGKYDCGTDTGITKYYRPPLFGRKNYLMNDIQRD